MNNYKVLGLMSGTSLDGLDLAYCHIREVNEGWDFNIEATKSVSYDAEMKENLKKSILLAADDLLIFHNSYGTWLGEQARAFLSEKDLSVDFIASHGHTTHHKPARGLTFQIGSGQHLANASGYTTVCDFRYNDVALGGQGAPLVPIGDRLFFAQYSFCLNLGGISNISFEYQGNRIAYDIGLANMILNHITQKIDLPFDKGGQLAGTGTINSEMLNQLNELPYYQLPFPKSTGYEWFLEQVVPIVEQTDDTTENLLLTSIHHICEQIARQVKQQAPKGQNTILVTGGGALNHFLIDILQQKLGNWVQIVVPSRVLIEFKEALVFALMGVLRMQKKVNILSSVTGARKDSSSGVIYEPN